MDWNKDGNKGVWINRYNVIQLMKVILFSMEGNETQTK